MSIKYFLYWLPMIVIAFANATIRQLLFIKYMSELHAQQLSTITLIIFCSIYIWFVFPGLSIKNTRQSFLIGFVWVTLTAAFEISLGYLAKRSWSDLLQDYNIIAGHIWPVFLACLFLLPSLYYKIKKHISSSV